MKRSTVIAAAVMFVTFFALATGYATEKGKATVPYPEGYRNWTHVKSMVIQQGHPLFDAFGGIHHVYANKKALEAMKSGSPFPNGAVLIFDLLEAKSDNNALVEGPRKAVAVMQKDAKKFADTGGWGFQAFKGDTKERMVTDPKTACFNCHEPQKEKDYVFSTYRQ